MEVEIKDLPDMEVALKKIKDKDVSIIDYDIGIRSGSTLPDNKMMKLNMAMELATMQIDPSAPTDAQYVLEKIDDPAAKSVLQRKNIETKLGQKIQAMQADMEKTIEHLENATNESKEKDERSHDPPREWMSGSYPIRAKHHKPSCRVRSIICTRCMDSTGNMRYRYTRR